MRFSHLIFLFIVTILIASCGSGDNHFSISGHINGMPSQTVYISELGISQITLVDSSQSDASGNFKLSGAIPEPGLYRVSFSDDPNKNIILSIGGGSIKIAGEWNQIENNTVSGSPESESLSKLMAELRTKMKDFTTLNMILDTFRARKNDSMIEVVTQDIQERNFQLTQFIESYADSTKYLPNAIFAARCLNPEAEKIYLLKFADMIGKKFPSAKLTREYKTQVASMASPQQSQAAPAEMTEGSVAPEISLETIDGKTITLSSFKGKYVLVDFWASWCGPCRRENPNVVAAFKKFSTKNFTILGVSLDDDKEKWASAIEKDGLTWTHVSDLKGWESIAARTYGVNSIPANFLIDPNGVIIARDLRGADLETKLTEVLK